MECVVSSAMTLGAVSGAERVRLTWRLDGVWAVRAREEGAQRGERVEPERLEPFRASRERVDQVLAHGHSRPSFLRLLSEKEESVSPVCSVRAPAHGRPQFVARASRPAALPASPALSPVSLRPRA